MNWRYRALALAVIVLVSTSVPALGATPSAEFDADVVETTAGETAEIPVTLSETDTATVKIGSERVNYIATVAVHDGNDDQTVTLQYDTSKAGHGGAFSVADDADTVTVESETDFDDEHLLDAGSYELAVAPGNESAENETDVATLAISESESDTETGTETTTPGPHAGHVTDIEDGVVVAQAQNQIVTGTLDLEPGTEILVEARNGGQFLKTNVTTVADDGGFRASFDFDDLPSDSGNGSEFDVVIRVDGEKHQEVTGVIRTPPTTETTEQAMQDETTRDSSQSQDGSIPGFSLVTGAVAVTAVALLALRRDV